MEQPDLYRHPEPSSTNPYWSEEIVLGPGPPPRRTGRKAHNGSQRGITTAGTHSTGPSRGGSSLDMNHPETTDPTRTSDDTLSGDNWNRRRYQREDEELWGFGEPDPTMRKGSQINGTGSSVGVAGISRPGTAYSAAESYYAARAPPVNDLHPPVVSMPSPNAADNKWMLQPPPRAKIMNGKERATDRSRSGSGTSSRIELNLQRQVSVRQLQVKLERGETPEMPPLSRGSCYRNATKGQRHDRDLKTPKATLPSLSRSRKKRRSTVAISSDSADSDSSGESSDTIVHTAPTNSPTSPPGSSPPSLRIVRVRNSRHKLSTVLSGESACPSPSQSGSDQNAHPSPSKPRRPARISRSTTITSSDSIPLTMKSHAPLAASDVSSLNILQDLVSPHALLNSRFVSAPLMEARIQLPESDRAEEMLLVDMQHGGALKGDERVLGKVLDGQGKERSLERDPRTRWSVDF